jgi:hypothetical protein
VATNRRAIGVPAFVGRVRVPCHTPAIQPRSELRQRIYEVLDLVMTPPVAQEAPPLFGVFTLSIAVFVAVSPMSLTWSLSACIWDWTKSVCILTNS